MCKQSVQRQTYDGTDISKEKNKRLKSVVSQLQLEVLLADDSYYQLSFLLTIFFFVLFSFPTRHLKSFESIPLYIKEYSPSHQVRSKFQ